jgi:hypothetical protein
MVTRDVAMVALNRSPQSLTYWMDSILEVTDEQARGEVKKALMKVVAEQQGSQITQFSRPMACRSIPIADQHGRRHAPYRGRLQGGDLRASHLPLHLDLQRHLAEAQRLRDDCQAGGDAMSASLPGLFPQGFSFMAILELSAGASLAPRLWWAERALGIALVSAGLATAAPAYADQTCWLPTMAPCAAKPRPKI